MSYVYTETSSCCCPLQLNTTKTNKQEREEQSCSIAHWSSNLTTQWHSCRLTMTMTQRSMHLEMSTKTWHGTHFILSLGGKMSFVHCCDTNFIFTIVFPISPCIQSKHEFWAPCLKTLLHAIWVTESLDVANFQHQMEATVGRVKGLGLVGTYLYARNISAPI
jgi:hypothetical protein